MPISDLVQPVFAALPRTGTDGPSSKFVAIPGSGEPRWLLPKDCRNIGPVLASWSPYRFSSRLKWRMIRAANRIRAVGLLPNSTTAEIANVRGIDWHSLGWSGDAPPMPIIYVGTPGISRKAVIHLVGRVSRQCGAIVKVPLAQGARQAILREADMLATLAEEKYDCAPRLLYVNREFGIATQTFIPGAPSGRRFSVECGDLLRCLMLHEETTTIAQRAAELQESPAWASHPEILSAALAELGDTHLLPACWVHGDFAPWNIKRRTGQKLMLIDWEDARRGGLPLHDHFHFLHMQDYVFGQRPAMHFAGVGSFAETIGITTTQCRQLEIAYLADSYLKCMARQEHVHADFLLQTIKAAVEARQRPLVVPNDEVAKLHSAGRQFANQSPRIRAQLLAAMIAQFNSAGIRYCVLSGYDKDGESASDVDIMIHPRDLASVPAMLTQSARSAGAGLVQAIRHETTGCYFILAKQDGRDVGFLDPDCCSDYRRGGRLWLSADQVIAGNRRSLDIYVPSIPDEFTYYLLKKILKQSITAHQLKRLHDLFASDTAECQRRLARFWPETTALRLQRAFVEEDLSWLQTRLEDLLLELKRSAPMERWFGRCAARLHDLMRLLQRIVYPTGMSVLVMGGKSSLRSTIADGLVENLSPAFRWTSKTTLANGVPSALSLAAKVFCARRRSTLIVSTFDLEPPATSLYQTIRRLWSMLTLWLSHPDLVLKLESGSADKTLGSTERNTNLVAQRPRPGAAYLDANSSPKQIIAEGTRVALDWLASRLERRLAGTVLSAHAAVSFDHVAEPVELRSAGLD